MQHEERNILDCPTEIIYLIISLLDIRSAVRFAQCQRLFYDCWCNDLRHKHAKHVFDQELQCNGWIENHAILEEIAKFGSADEIEYVYRVNKARFECNWHKDLLLAYIMLYSTNTVLISTVKLLNPPPLFLQMRYPFSTNKKRTCFGDGYLRAIEIVARDIPTKAPTFFSHLENIRAKWGRRPRLENSCNCVIWCYTLLGIVLGNHMDKLDETLQRLCDETRNAEPLFLRDFTFAPSAEYKCINSHHHNVFTIIGKFATFHQLDTISKKLIRGQVDISDVIAYRSIHTALASASVFHNTKILDPLSSIGLSWKFVIRHFQTKMLLDELLHVAVDTNEPFLSALYYWRNNLPKFVHSDLWENGTVIIDRLIATLMTNMLPDTPKDYRASNYDYDLLAMIIDSIESPF